MIDDGTRPGNTATGPHKASRRRPSSVSVVIPAFNARAVIDAQLDALENQDYGRPFEVVVSDNGSTDGLREHLRSRPRAASFTLLVVDASGKRGAAYARNVGARCASGEFIAFCDADDLVYPQWLRALVTAAGSDDVVTTAVEGESLNQRGRRWTPIPTPQHFQPATFLPVAVGGSCGCWAEVFRSAGGFAEDWLANEDIDFAWRAQLQGYSLGYVPRALVAIRFRTSAAEGYRQGFARGVSLIRLGRVYPQSGLPAPRPATLLAGLARTFWSNPVVFDVPGEEWGLHVGVTVGQLYGIAIYEWHGLVNGHCRR